MSFKTSRSPSRYYDTDTVEVKSKLDAEFRRFSLDRRKDAVFEEFYTLLAKLHQLVQTEFVILYPDQYGDLLPINNNDNYYKALQSSKPVLRLQLQRKGESYLDQNGYAGVTMRKRNPIISKLIAQEPKRPNIRISQPEDFRRVSAIIDVDIVPDTCRRVKLMKNGQDKPLGFYIRDGTSLRATQNGIEKVPGIFISRLVPGGLAESTGLIAVNDEVLEVNGIEVAGKTLDQVTDMMVANSSNLIITVKPVNQRNTLARPSRGGSNRQSQLSTLSTGSSRSRTSQDSDDITDHFTKVGEPRSGGGGDEEEEEDDDEVCDHMARMATTDDLTSCGNDLDIDEVDDNAEYHDATEGDTSGLVEVSANEGVVNHHHQPKPVMSL